MPNKPLDLDELFGLADPIIVRFQGKDYELYRPDSWTPETYTRYVRLQKRVNTSEIESAMENPAAMEKLADALRGILEIISPELAALELSFEKQSAIVNHYAAQVFPTELAAAQDHTKNRIGA